MIKNITLALFAFASFNVCAQVYVHQVLVLNEGYNDFTTGQQVVPVSIATFDPQTAAYNEVVSIADVRFASDILVNDEGIFVAADTLLLKYDKDNFQLLAQETLVGVRKLAEWNGQLVITRGELGGLNHFVEVRDQSDLSLDYTIDISDGLQWSCEGVTIVNDVAYLAVNNAFDWANLVGKVGMIDLNTESFTGAVDLGPNGLNPENLMVNNGKIYTLNNKDFTGSSISEFDLATSTTIITQDISLSSGCGASVMADDHIYFQEYALGKLSRYDFDNHVVVDTLVNTASYYGLVDDEINGVIYSTTTDFFSSGEIHVVSYSGTTLSSTTAGISAGNLALDLRSSTAINETPSRELAIQFDGEFVTVPSAGTVQLFSVTGSLVKEIRVSASARSFSVAALPAGVYLVKQNGRSARIAH